MPNDSAKELPGTAAYREKHPFNWLSQANYNPAYDPMRFGANGTVNPNSGAGLLVTGGPMRTAPVTVSSTTVPYGEYIAGLQGNSITSPTINAQPLQQAVTANNTVAPQSTPQVTLPAEFQQNYSNPTPAAGMGIKMPDIKTPLQGFGGGTNWTDFLTIANNRR